MQYRLKNQNSCGIFWVYMSFCAKVDSRGPIHYEKCFFSAIEIEVDFFIGNKFIYQVKSET